MPYSMHWHIPGAIVFLEFSVKMSRDEMRNSRVELAELMATTDREIVHTISDVSEVTDPYR